MRHGRKISKLSRPAEHRRAMLNNLAAALITHKQIQTTDTKAKALKPYIDRLISTARENSLSARRQVAQAMPNKEAYKELFNVVIPKLEGRTSGFSRIVKYGFRRGDGASLSIIQLLLEKDVEDKAHKKGKKKAVAGKPSKAREEKVSMSAAEEAKISRPEAASEAEAAASSESGPAGDNTTNEPKPEEGKQ